MRCLVLALLMTGCTAASIGQEPDIQTEPAAPSTDEKSAKAAETTSAPTAETTSPPTPVPADDDSSIATTTTTTTTAGKSTGATPPSTVALSWNQVTSTAQFSLDVLTKDKGWIAPCVSADVLDRKLAYSFDGNCVTPGSTFALGDVSDFRVCWAENGDWAHGKCEAAGWDGTSAAVALKLSS